MHCFIVEEDNRKIDGLAGASCASKNLKHALDEAEVVTKKMNESAKNNARNLN